MTPIFDKLSDAMLGSMTSDAAKTVSKDSFVPISPLDEETAKKTKIAFIDGGNAELIASPSLSLQFIRVCALVFAGKQYLNAISLKHEFFVLVKPETRDGKTLFKTEFFSESEKLFLENLSFDAVESDGETAPTSPKKSLLASQVGEAVRRISELIIAKQAASQLEENDVIVLDGSLEASYPEEASYLDELFSVSKRKNICLVGLSKTSLMLSKEGTSVVASLSAAAPEESWYYQEKHSSTPVQLAFARLHKRSKHVFRIDAFGKDWKHDSRGIMSLLAFHSSDPAFPGYPYGLIKTDSLARISKNETELLKTRLVAKLESSGQDSVGAYINSLNAHSILDKLSY